jgi:hypothetical protein
MVQTYVVILKFPYKNLSIKLAKECFSSSKPTFWERVKLFLEKGSSRQVIEEVFALIVFVNSKPVTLILLISVISPS